MRVHRHASAKAPLPIRSARVTGGGTTRDAPRTGVGARIAHPMPCRFDGQVLRLFQPA
jgi:hypothetical protein